MLSSWKSCRWWCRFGIDRIVKGLNNAIKGDENITILLETMSGKGTEIGFKFEQLKV